MSIAQKHRQLLILIFRSNETDPLLSRERHRQNHDLACCFFITIGAIFILGVFYFLPSMPPDKIAWTNLESHSCTSYATREYVAEMNVSPWSRQWTNICMSTPVVVHGQPHFPSRCEYRSGTVIGHFAVKYNEPDCVTYWSGYRDWGCIAKGSRKRVRGRCTVHWDLI
ncbi:uncharacterized protein HD556DRAFT_1409615 [Suillus plorans]|uniref:Transmembrane protein n=1 Tax=Suillus plorans TaxID=116603 RepID=A0A9P7AFN6_9AGAM|nr:uncharacterized protein HD556DRAFT_1409615 [Suillus plorans]KAG1787340.1 hypothetical protein HD556DRAFT_1409615 [Suillus plorans]